MNVARGCRCATGSTTHLGIGDLRDLLEVILRPGCDFTEEDLLGHPTSQHHTHPIQQLLLGVQVLLPGEVLGVAQAFASRYDGYLAVGQTSFESKARYDTI